MTRLLLKLDLSGRLLAQDRLQGTGCSTLQSQKLHNPRSTLGVFILTNALIR